jgi:hypothetical protein
MGTRHPHPGLPAFSNTFHIPAIKATKIAIIRRVLINETISSIRLLFV